VSLSPEELSQLIDSHWNPLVAWVGSAPDAEDIVQQAFVALAGLSQEPDNPRAWLYRAAKNRAINAHKSSMRRAARQKLASKSESVTTPVSSMAETDELRSFLAQLSQEQREIVAAKIWGQLTFEEIASMQGIAKATAWRTYNAAIETLRNIYGINCEITNE
jgi:RNA polymerase sigma-70 factor (ECF subfamily)